MMRVALAMQEVDPRDAGGSTRPLAAGINVGDFVFFKLVNNYFNREIQDFGMALMGHAMR